MTSAMYVHEANRLKTLTATLLALVLIQCATPKQADLQRPAGVRQAIDLLSKKGQILRPIWSIISSAGQN